MKTAKTLGFVGSVPVVFINPINLVNPTFHIRMKVGLVFLIIARRGVAVDIIGYIGYNVGRLLSSFIRSNQPDL